MSLRLQNRPTRFRSWLRLGTLALGLAGANAAWAQAPIWQASSAIATSTGADVTVTLPAHQAGDIFLLQVVVRDTNDTITWPAGWTQIATVDRGTTARYWWAWSRATSSSETNPLVNKSTSTGDTYAVVTTYRGALGSGSPWDVIGTPNSATTAAHVLNGVTTTVADTLLIASICGEDNSASSTSYTATDPSSLSEVMYRESQTGSDGVCAAGAAAKPAAGATGNVTATWNATVRGSGGIVLALKPSGVPVGFPLTQCVGDRFGSDLGCTANDVQITSLTAVGGPPSCKAGDFLTLDFDVTVNSGAPNRYDIGIFFSNDGKDPQLVLASGGPATCSVFTLPTNDPPFRNLDPGPHSGTLDTCGDVNGTMNPTGIGGVSQGSGVLRVTGVTVKCQAMAGSNGKLFVPFVVSWDQQASPTGATCTSAANPVPGTTSKCNAPTVAQATVTGIVVLPKIEKSDGITVIDRNQTTNYSVVITNNTGDAVTGAVFTDPAVADLTANSVSCVAAGGATCPASPTVAAMQGAGIALPSMPSGSSLTFTINATVSGTVAYGTLLTNTASVTTNFQTTSATDTNTVGTTVLDHYELSLPANSVACSPTTVTVTACASAAGASPCTNIYSGADVAGYTATLTTTGGTIGDSTPTFASGVASTTLSYPAATNGTVVTMTLAGVPVSAPNPARCCQGGSCTTGNSCATTFMRNALYISDTNGGGQANIPPQTAGVRSGTFWLRAVRTRFDGSCDDALTGSASIDFAYECNNPATCYAADMMKIDTGPVTTITRNNSGSVTSYMPVTLTFNNAGYAPFALLYNDVGLVTLHTRYVSGSLTGASNAFVVKPYNFLLANFRCTSAGDCATGNTSSPNNPGAADETGLPFMKAGSPFSVTVTAVNANGDATPSYGRETPAEGIKLTPTLVSPAGGNNPAVTYTTGVSFTNGVGTGTTFSWGEVGIITVRPSIDDGNYLSAGDVIGSASGNLGRFIPHHFKVTATPGCSGGASFTYAGQPFAATATARNLAGTTTLNYRGTSPIYAKATTFTDADASDTATCTNNTLLAANYSAGVGTQSGVVCTFPAKETAPGITLRAVDADNATSADGNASSDGDASVDLRSGRVRLFSAYGSELIDLAVPMRVEYYISANDGWVTNTGDTCSSVKLGTFTNFRANLNSGETCVQDTGNPGVSGQGCPVVGPVAELYATTPLTGGYNLWLKAPGAGNNGSVDLSADLSTSGKTWLRYDWSGSGESDPTAKATFGLWRGNPRHIHLRELY